MEDLTENETTPVQAQQSKKRSSSDPANAPSTLAPSPSFREKHKLETRDDHAVPTTPKSRRPDFLSRGLSLQMPSQEMPSPARFPRPAPLSPQLDQHNIYMQSQNLSASPATALPRHSRGLDFSRASTHLHHSTLAEKNSNDSSPIISQKGLNIPRRNGSISSMMLDSLSMTGGGFSSVAPERSAVSSSLGSVNMLASESESDDSDDDASMAGDDNDDLSYNTPQMRKLHNPSAPTPFTGSQTPSGGTSWGAHFSPAQTSLMKTIRHPRLHKDTKRGRKRSSSASGSGYSSMASPRTGSPPAMRSIENSTNSGYFQWTTAARSRRESLAMGTDGLNLSSGNDSGDEAVFTAPSTPGVVRRAVTRRQNLLPKTKGFARIRAALAEEATPVDTESRREAETIRQVRERDSSITELDLERPGTATAASSPSLLPAVPENAQEDFGRDLEIEGSNSTKGLGMNFAAHASRNSGGLDYWNRFDSSMRTPPPPSLGRQGSQISDVNMDSPAGGDLWRRPRARSSASEASEAFGPIRDFNTAMNNAGMNDDVHLKKFKRRREDDFDMATIKRRAVSPGISAQNSPVLSTQSPSQKDINGLWGMPPDKKDKAYTTTTALGTPLGQTGKKIGLQGMVDTNDGLMKMSIE
ncbi:Hypothetical protein R9X50_00388800 [Acrodontium crateriforme]|uniref:Uncharacterized protein n=1 Tax=Acrodontium crateriforme TaxID=150365 RepID=A0AAQ3M4F5_9PEZI|nr:Hypothetical protein R9X50_00388800 [Acrodontium crateriforme]